MESLRVTVPEIWPGQKWWKKEKKKRKKNEHGQNYIASPTGIAKYKTKRIQLGLGARVDQLN